MRKMKKATPATTVAILILLAAGTQPIEMPKADSPDPNQPKIKIISPFIMRVYNSSNIDLNIEITKPNSWFIYGWYYKPSSSSSGIPFDPRDLAKGYGCIGRINYVECTLDSEIIQTFPIDDGTPFTYSEYPLNTKLRFSRSLNIPEGVHTLKITVFGSYATDRYYPNYTRILQVVNSSAETMLRTWYSSPKISVMSPQNITYSEKAVPITLELDRPASCTYHLDENHNLSLSGNTTITELTEGQHNLVIYAKDPAGNEGKSETVCFGIALPTPSPSTTQILEPTPEFIPKQPTSTAFASPTSAVSPTKEILPETNLILVVVLSAFLIAAAVAIAVLKSKTKPQNLSQDFLIKKPKNNESRFQSVARQWRKNLQYTSPP
jgi:hypothetical protein